MKKNSITRELNSLYLANETIAFQSGKFGAELEEFIKDARRKYSNIEEFTKARTVTKMSEIIKKHTGMLINIDIDYLSKMYNCGPAIMLPNLSANHIFNDNYIKPFIDRTTSERFIKSIENHKGKNGVDLKTSKVFGVFEDIEVTMLLPVNNILEDYLSAGDVAAIMLHEIGHLFTYFEYFGRTVTTNQVLTNLCECLENEKDTGIREDMISKAVEVLSYKQELPKELLEETDSRKIAIKLMRYVYTSSETGSYKYDESNCETLADQFATRHGYGLQLASALYKISPTERSENTVARSAMYVSETIFLLLTTSTLGAIAVSFTGSIGVGIAAFFFITLAVVTNNSTNNMYNAYDTFPTRLKKIREQLVQSTRVKTRKKTDLALILSQIEDIDKLIKYSIDSGYLLRTIADFIRPSNKSSAASIVLNRRLEELASNDLFVGAAKLKTLL